MERLVDGLKEMKENKMFIRGTEQPWWTALKQYARDAKNMTGWEDFARSEDDFGRILSDFLFSPIGSGYRGNFMWDGDLACNSPAPRIVATKFPLQFETFDGPAQHVPTRRAVESLIRQADFSSAAFSHHWIYATWETDEIIGHELWRNIGLAMACVFLVTLVLLASLRLSLLVLLCVVLTLVDIVGFLHFWGTALDTISMVNIVVAVGLCVDYAVHIAHGFLASRGTREERSVETLVTIGPAVLNGGVTTFIALILLIFSSSHVFVTFFRTFTLTVVFGLFHAIIFLPVVLSLVGPPVTVDSSVSEGSKSTSDIATRNTTSTDIVVDIVSPKVAGSRPILGPSYSRSISVLVVSLVGPPIPFDSSVSEGSKSTSDTTTTSITSSTNIVVDVVSPRVA